MRYCLERRDDEFERKRHDVLMVYRAVFMTPAAGDIPTANPNNPPAPIIYTVSVDEKPGVQALGTPTPDRPRVGETPGLVTRPGNYPSWHPVDSGRAGSAQRRTHRPRRTETSLL